MIRYFRCTTPEEKTRGEYGVGIRGGHTTDDAPEHISVFDPDFGDMLITSIRLGVESGMFVEVTKAEYDAI